MKKIKLIGSFLLLGMGITIITSSIVNANSEGNPIKSIAGYGIENINGEESVDSTESSVEVSPYSDEIASRKVKLTTDNE